MQLAFTSQCKDTLVGSWTSFSEEMLLKSSLNPSSPGYKVCWKICSCPTSSDGSCLSLAFLILQTPMVTEAKTLLMTLAKQTNTELHFHSCLNHSPWSAGLRGMPSGAPYPSPFPPEDFSGVLKVCTSSIVPLVPMWKSSIIFQRSDY